LEYLSAIRGSPSVFTKAAGYVRGCPIAVFATLKKMKMIVTGDIGCYTLGTLPPLMAWIPASAWALESPRLRDD